MTTERKDNERKQKTNNADGTNILLLGGCGFIGRNLVNMLIKQGGFNITVADKLIPATAYMTPEMMVLYKSPNVTLIQSDLTKDQHIQKVFADDRNYDFVVNMCGETRFGQSDNDIKVKSVDTAIKTIAAAEKLKSLKKWIEVSTAQVYKPAKKPANEEAKTDPFTKVGKVRMEVEGMLAKSKLPYVVLRPAIVYGPADKSGLTPRLIVAACYKIAKETMTMLWTKNLGLNTVHVRDVCSAILLACNAAKPGSIYNLADGSNSTSGSINGLLEKVFGIKCTFHNMMVNKAASLMSSQLAAMSNNKHVPMWNDVCKAYNITSSPLTPYMDLDVLSEKNLFVDGTRICKDLSFEYKVPQVTVEGLQEVVDEYVAQEYFPDFKNSLAGGNSNSK